MHLGPPYSPDAQRLMILGSGELGKEIVIEAQRLGLETIAVDRYAHAPAMAVAHRSHVLDMTDAPALKAVIQHEQPHFVVPELEAIATDVLLDLESQGLRVIPNARAVQLTMDREGIRRLAKETLDLPTADYVFCDSLAELEAASRYLGFPFVVKPLMSSSGKGQSLCTSADEVKQAWTIATQGGRVSTTRVIAEAFIAFDAEITLLTVRSVNGTFICPPIGHRQQAGDYVESWQPHWLPAPLKAKSEHIARTITEALGGLGLFGVELFVAGDLVYFSEVSPRPHDTGLVTLVSQDLSEFALHIRALLGLPLSSVALRQPAASRAIKAPWAADSYIWHGLEAALAVPGTTLRLFGKPTTTLGRRVGVVLNQADTVDQAREQAEAALQRLDIRPAEAQNALDWN